MNTRKYWIELFQAFFSSETEDRIITLDDYDVADYLQMAVETTFIEVVNRKYKGVGVSSMANWYRNLPVVGNKTVLPFSPVLQDAGIITVVAAGTMLMPRSEGVDSTALAFLKGKGVMPSYVVDGRDVTWEYVPPFQTADFFMVPNITELEDDDEYKLAAGIKDIVFTRVKAIAFEKQRFKPDYKNNTNANDGAPNMPQ
jgi:hypothetical protein